MSPETLKSILSIAGILGSSGIITLIIYLLGRKSGQAKALADTGKVEAETRQTEIKTRQTEVEIYASMQSAIDTLSERVDKLVAARERDRAKIDQLETEILELKAEIRELKRERIGTDKEVARLRKMVTYYRAVSIKLVEQLRAGGIVPAWKPVEPPPKEEPKNGASK